MDEIIDASLPTQDEALPVRVLDAFAYCLRLFHLLSGEGEHVQYSVFFCDCSPAELARLCGKISEIINSREDQVLLLDLGPAHLDLQDGLEVFGLPYKPQVRTIVV